MIQVGMEKDPDLPDVPYLMDLVRNEEDRQIVKLVFGSQEMARPFVAPPGVPAGQIASLRRAFEETLADPQFVAEAEKTNLPVKLTRWDKVEALIRDVYATPPSVIERAARIVGGH
jgi:hypothetical protein